MNPTISALVFAGLAVALPAQVTVPATAASTDLSTERWIAGVGTTLRQQILVDQRHLEALVGREIDALLFRRDFGHGAALPAVAFDAQLYVSTSPHAAAAHASELLAANHGPDWLQVFTGHVTVPASADPSGRAPTWQSSDVVRIDFGTPFPYRGGTLCIDLTATTLAGRSFWPCDAWSDGATGVVRSIGTSCQDHAKVLKVGGTQSHFVDRVGLVPGGTVACSALAEPGASATLVFGLGELQPALDLGPFGAPGCKLHVDVIGAVSTVVVPPPPEPLTAWTGGVVRSTFQLPASAGLLGGRFTTQWVEVVPGRFATTNAVEATISGTLPTSGVALVEARFDGHTPPTHGEVTFHAVPVLRLEPR